MKPIRSLLALCPLMFSLACVVDTTPLDDDGAADDSTSGPMSSSGDANDETTGEAGEDSSSGGDDGMSVVQCDPWNEGDCGEGMKCMPYDAAPIELTWDSNGCYPVAQQANAPGDDCQVFESAVDGIDDCDEDSFCMPADFEDLEAGGTCLAFCEGTSAAPGCSDAGSTCIIANDGVLNICLPACDPTMSDCGEGEGCYLNPTDNKFFCFPQDEAAAEADSGYGAGCGTINFCDPGLQCDEGTKVPDCDSEEGYCCTEFCDLEDPEGDMQCSGFDGGQRCIAHFPEGQEPPGYEHVGICAIPAN